MPDLLRKMDLNLLLSFEAIYAARNISRAADLMGLTQPTMSNALGRLREALGDPLFVREGNTMRPTPRAETLIEPVRRALADLRSALEPQPPFDPATSEREFRLLITDGLEAAVLPHLFAQAGPGVRFRLVLAAMTPIVAALEEGLVDLVVNIPAPAHPDLRWEPLTPLDPVIVARRGHPALRAGLSWAELGELPSVVVDTAPGRMANAHLLSLSRRHERDDRMRVSRVATITELAARTDLIGVTSRLHALSCPDRDALQIVEPPEQLSNQTFNMTWHARTHEDQGVIWLRSRIAAAVAAIMAASRTAADPQLHSSGE